MTGGGEGDPARVTAAMGEQGTTAGAAEEAHRLAARTPSPASGGRTSVPPGGRAKRQAWEGGGAAGGGQRAGVLPPSRAAGEGLVPFSRYPGPKSCARRHVCCWQEFSEAVGWM